MIAGPVLVRDRYEEVNGDCDTMAAGGCQPPAAMGYEIKYLESFPNTTRDEYVPGEIFWLRNDSYIIGTNKALLVMNSSSTFKNPGKVVPYPDGNRRPFLTTGESSDTLIVMMGTDDLLVYDVNLVRARR